MGTQESISGLFAGTAATACEEQLVAGLRSGSLDAFNELIAIFHQPLFRFVYRLSGDTDDAADILQDVFLKVFRSATHFEARSSLKTWVYQIALHEASNHRRWWCRHKRQETSLEAEGERGANWTERLADRGQSPLSQVLSAERKVRLQRALDSVPEPYHAVLILRELEEFSYEEIAEIIQARVGTVKSRLVRGREMLRQVLLRDRAAVELLGAAQESL